MTREQAKHLIPLMEAHARGEAIQALDHGEWVDTEDPQFGLFEHQYFRIKPTPREWWINTYEGNAGAMYPTKEIAKAKKGSAASETIHVREVLD